MTSSFNCTHDSINLERESYTSHAKHADVSDANLYPIFHVNHDTRLGYPKITKTPRYVLNRI